MFARQFQKIALCGLALFIGSLSTAGVAMGADLSQAVVQEKYNVVTVAPNLGAQGQPAAQGAVVQDGNVVRTGTASRAILEFADLTQSRMGANSIFSFDAKARVMNFNKGAVLFSKPTNSGAIQLRSGAVTAAITGSTGFISTVPIEGVGKAGQTQFEWERDHHDRRHAGRKVERRIALDGQLRPRTHHFFHARTGRTARGASRRNAARGPV